MSEEPARNISRGIGTSVEFASDDVDTRAEAVVDALGELYWQKTYGGQTAFECLVRTVLSQNTSDKASQPAHDSLMARYGGSGGSADANDEKPETTAGLAAALADADRDELASTISSAGLYNQKSKTIVRLARRVVEEYGGDREFDDFVKNESSETVREALLDMKGVGPKTADCVLLFSGGRGGVFPVDTHVHRVSRRLGVAPPDADHERVREFLERDVSASKCGFGHTAMLQFGREFCSARQPACLDGPEACPLSEHCERVGVDESAGTVEDPAVVAE